MQYAYVYYAIYNICQGSNRYIIPPDRRKADTAQSRRRICYHTSIFAYNTLLHGANACWSHPLSNSVLRQKNGGQQIQIYLNPGYLLCYSTGLKSYYQ